MYTNSTELKSSLSPSIHSRSIVTTNNLLENDRILDTLTDLLFTLLDEIFISFPIIRESLIIKHYTDISKFLVIHNTNFDSITMKIFDDFLKLQLKNYAWELKLKNSILSQWRNILMSQSSLSLTLIEDQITEITKDSEKNFEHLLNLFQGHLEITQLATNPFPSIYNFRSFFSKTLENLKQKTLFIQNQEKLINAQIQKAQVEHLVKKVQTRTEWINFSETITEAVDYERVKSSLLNCCKRCINRTLISKTVNCIYKGASGWEITRVYAEINDGSFSDISILSSKISENLVYVEVEVWFRKFAAKQVWFSLKVEGTSCRKRNFESTVSEIKEFLVVVDSTGAHEIDEDV